MTHLTPIETRIGVSRSNPWTPPSGIPSGTVVPSPSDIRWTNREPAGRSTGGFYVRTMFSSMQWVYNIRTNIYETLMFYYDPVNPWRWVYFYSDSDDAGIWAEAVMREPTIERLQGNVESAVSVTFSHITKWGG